MSTSDPAAAGQPGAPPVPLRRSALLQARSRRTRQALVRAALDLWSKRGFETGVEETTVEEIAKAAGVTKGTFYFHFARKEHILLEMGWATAQVVYDEATRALAAGLPPAATLDALMASLARRVEAAPKPAVARAVAEFQRVPGPKPLDEEHFGFVRAFTAVFADAQARGLLDDREPADELGAMLQALTTDAIMRWATSDQEGLRERLQRRAALLLTAIGGPAGRSPQGDAASS